MPELLKILLLEDSVTDTEMVLRGLKKAKMQFESRWATDRESYLLALDEFKPDLILADNSLPQFDATEALDIRNQRNLLIPFILITGTVSEEFAASIIKLGADDYILKDRLTRLPGAIAAALKQRSSEKEKLEAIEKLKENEKKYRELVERISDGFIALDLDGCFTYVNKKAEELFKKPYQYLLSKNLWTEYPESSDMVFFKAYLRAMETQENVHLKEYSFAIDKWVETNIYPSATGISVYFRDITEQKKAEEQIEFDSNNLKALINNTHDLMWSVDKELNLITSNESFDQAVMTMSGKPIARGTNILKGNFYKEQLAKFRKYYERAFSGETFTEIERNSETSEDFISEISFYPIYRMDKVVGTACFSRNITKRIKAEEKLIASEKHFRHTLDNMLEGIQILDFNWRYIYVNDVLEKVSKFSKDEMLGYTMMEKYPGVELTGLFKRLQRCMTERLTDHFETEFTFPDGTKADYELSIQPVTEGLFILSIDITQRKKTEENLRSLEQEIVEQKIQEQKKMARAIIRAQENERSYIGRELHDNITQILAGSKMYLGTAGNKDAVLKETIKYPVELIDSAIREIQSLTRIMVTPQGDINLEELVQLLLNNLAESTSIQPVFVYNVPAKDIDNDQKLNIYRIIQEQVNNITKYAGAKKITITIAADKEMIHIVLTDDGKGFDMAKKRKGIGISNMMNRTLSFNGQFTIESSPGNGCRVNVNMPVATKNKI